MVYKGKFRIIDNNITACDYNFILSEIDRAIKNKKKLLISPIASHTLVRAHYDKALKRILDKFNYLVPDSQWVRWSIPFLYGKEMSLNDRVYGPNLMLRTCNLSTKRKYRVFLYGNTKEVLEKLEDKLLKKYINLKIVQKEESKFRDLTNNEWKQLSNEIVKSKADIIFISLGSPKQEIFSYKLSLLIKKPIVIIPVGAAFDFISKNKPQAPNWIQKIGLEWLYRILQEPFRLWRRYLIFGSLFSILVIRAKLYRRLWI